LLAAAEDGFHAIPKNLWKTPGSLLTD